MRVLVPEAGAAAAVAATRCLGRHGHEVVIGRSPGDVPLAGLSRYCAAMVPLPSPARSPRAYADAVGDALRRYECDALLPVTDQSLLALAETREEIETVASYCAASETALTLASDKWIVAEHGRRHGLDVPDSALIARPGDWEAASGRVGVPCVVRSRTSFLRGSSGLIKPSSRVHFRMDDAAGDVNERLGRGEEMVVSAYVEGRGRGVYLFLCDGEARLWFGHDRIRETDPRGGPACAARSLPPSPAMVERCRSLLASWGFEGAAMVEFRRDEATGREWLVEVNPRLWGSLPLAVHAGVEFPLHQVLYFTEGRRPSMPKTVPAIGARQLSAELIHLLHAWQGPPAGWERGYPTFRDALRDFVDGFREGLRFYHQSAEDPLPGVVEPIANLVAGLRKAAV
ncbi:MAG TPA: ATP-grasp domain-containing protein [Candidatus Polarisedimenticolaceae bacterium]|nr:ATP-grasp domain-containing protein [Candidatus Polarisedimenticolaceae bacterium]